MRVSIDFESCGLPFVVVFVFSCSIGCVFEEFVGAFGFSSVCSFWCHSAVFALFVVCSLGVVVRVTCLFMNAMI